MYVVCFEWGGGGSEFWSSEISMEGKGGQNFGHLKFPWGGEGGEGSEFWSSEMSLERV